MITQSGEKEVYEASGGTVTLFPGISGRLQYDDDAAEKHQQRG